MVVQSHSVSSLSKSKWLSTWRAIRFRKPQALFPIFASSPRAMAPAASWNSYPEYLGSRYPAYSSAYLKAMPQNAIQNWCASMHLGSMPTSSIISQKSGCRLWSIAVNFLYSRALRNGAKVDIYLSSGTVNFIAVILNTYSGFMTLPLFQVNIFSERFPSSLEVSSILSAFVFIGLR